MMPVNLTNMPAPSLAFFAPDFTTALALPLAASPISAGFPSSAEEFVGLKLNLNDELIKHPEATFYAKVKGHSMINAGIADGDLLVIDKALEQKDGDIAVCFIDGEFTLKRLALKEDGIYLMPANAEYKPIKITEDNDFLIWGILSYVIHKPR